MHAISIHQGPDVPIDESGWPHIQCDLGVVLTVHAKNTSTLIDTDLNQIEKEINVALFVDPQFGLAFVADLTPGPVEEPEAESEGAIVSATMRTTWIIRYTRDRADPST